ncbi:ribonuclease H-like protein, partial [Lojkania enalia]
MQASPNTEGAYYSHLLYRGPEGQMISLHYCPTMETAEKVAKYFLDEKVLGFDIEWRPWGSGRSIKDNVSLIQLACEDRIALFHISQFKGNSIEQLLPPTLKTILESPNILKVGVNIKGDFGRLQTYLGVHARGKYELSRLYNLVKFSATDPSKVNNKMVSLARQVEEHLQLPLLKDSDVREGDWRLGLNKKQMRYAATDAYAGLRIFDVLEEKRKKLKPIPPLPMPTDFDPPPRLRE